MEVERPEPDAAPRGTGARAAAGGALAWLAAMAPHLLHHAGLVAGGAFLAGWAGSVLLLVLGAAAMVPLVLRRRRRGERLLPVVAMLALMAVVFAATRVAMG